jgi:hypothetical protein
MFVFEVKHVLSDCCEKFETVNVIRNEKSYKLTVVTTWCITWNKVDVLIQEVREKKHEIVMFERTWSIEFNGSFFLIYLERDKGKVMSNHDRRNEHTLQHIFKNCWGYRFLLTACVRQKIQWTMTHCELRCLHVDTMRNHLVFLNWGQWPRSFCYALGHRRKVSVGW